MEKEFKSHLKKQFEFREQYANTRAKNSLIKENLSFITDGAGSTGLVYCPRPKIVSKDMPARHEMMKIKASFSKVHGHGLIIDINL